MRPVASSKKSPKSPKERPPQVGPAADNVTLTISAEKDGKLRVTSRGLDAPYSVAVGKHLVVRNGPSRQVVVTCED